MANKNTTKAAVKSKVKEEEQVNTPEEKLTIQEEQVLDNLDNFIEDEGINEGNSDLIETINVDELLGAVNILLRDLDGVFIGGNAQRSKQALEQLINNK